MLMRLRKDDAGGWLQENPGTESPRNTANTNSYP